MKLDIEKNSFDWADLVAQLKTGGHMTVMPENPFGFGIMQVTAEVEKPRSKNPEIVFTLSYTNQDAVGDQGDPYLHKLARTKFVYDVDSQTLQGKDYELADPMMWQDSKDRKTWTAGHNMVGQQVDRVFETYVLNFFEERGLTGDKINLGRLETPLPPVNLVDFDPSKTKAVMFNMRRRFARFTNLGFEQEGRFKIGEELEPALPKPTRIETIKTALAHRLHGVAARLEESSQPLGHSSVGSVGRSPES